MSSYTFNAYVDDKDVIIIEYDRNNPTFFLNDKLLKVNFIKKINNISIYEAKVELDFKIEYYIRDNYFLSKPLVYRNFIKKDSFDQLFYYDKNDLGANYSKEKTIFKLWAPISTQCYLKYYLNEVEFIEKMDKNEKGVFSCIINKDLDGAFFCYLIKTNGTYYEITDPYAYSCNANNTLSAVIDISKTNINLNQDKLKKFEFYNEAIIYEINIRDFTIADFYKDNKYSFKGLSIEGLKNEYSEPLGIDYLKKLGITHLQIMPIIDFATVDENNKFNYYNWGYDPVCFNILDGSYATNSDNPYCRIKEFKTMISVLHKNNIRVNIDVVFNHLYNKDDNIFNKIVPNYFFLTDQEGNYSNGSYCGNDIDTTRKMVQKHLLDMVERYINFYGIDGLRLDLMGILDYNFVNKIYDIGHKYKSDFMLYGEGWDMPSMLNKEKRASFRNIENLQKVAFFNDFFRDVLKGRSFENNLYEQGYLNGNSYLIELAMKALKGSIDEGCYFNNTSNSINYVECHDNATIYDKFKKSNFDYTEQERNKLQILNIAAVIFSLGIPFLHSGMELNRTKKDVLNSYNSGDDINHFPWENLHKLWKNVEIVSNFIETRKKYNVFKLTNKEFINQHFKYEKIGNDILKITYHNLQSIDNIQELVLIFNNQRNKFDYCFNSEYFLICNDEGKCNKIINEYTILPLSFSLFIKK